jgi:hypothetical protein
MHYIERCKVCGVIISQCRCPSKDKEEWLSICLECAKKEKEDKRE